VNQCFELSRADYALLFGEDLDLPVSKSDRLNFGLSMMTHAMVFTAVAQSPDDDASLPTKFRVENSWGEEGGDKGYLVMTDDWFREFVLEVVVDKKYLPEEVLKAVDQPRVVLPPWDPMGALAQ
jgi:bleomycin hydrolase